MNHYSIYPLIIAVFLLLLGLTTLLYDRQKKENIIFAVYAALTGFVSLIDFIYRHVDSPDVQIFWLKAGAFSGFLTVLAIFLYILTLTGNLNQLHKKILGIPLSWYLFLLSGYLVLLFPILIMSDLVIYWPAIKNSSLNEKIIGPHYSLIVVGSIFLIAIFIPQFYIAFRQAVSRAKRQKLHFSFFAIVMLHLSSLLLVFYPYQSIMNMLISFIPLSTTFLFHLGIVCSRILEIKDLNARLEQKIEERTLELRETQAQLIQTERSAALVDLVAGVVHQVHSPLGALIGANDTLHRAAIKLQHQVQDEAPALLDKSSRISMILTIINKLTDDNRKNGRRIQAILKNLRHFTRLDESKMQMVNINDMIDTTLLFMAHQFRGRIQIQKEYEETGIIYCQPQLINQLFANILLNSVQAIDDQGIIRIRTEMKDKKVKITIVDTGNGIVPDDIPKIFDAGYTTRRLHAHAGMGLAIVRQIVHKHKGQIRVDSEIKNGTQFIIELPVDFEVVENVS